MHRRRFLALVGAAAAVAGCSGGGPQADGGRGSTDGGPAATRETPVTTAGTAATRTAGGDLDLREANVTAVEFERTDGAYDFDVTLHHDDDGEEGYANWWQVETPDGERLGRRELLHAHGTREFTRSATVEISGDVACVVVRGHDQTHGYGGQATLVNLNTGATRPVRQGPEPRSFAPDDCP